MDEYSRFVTKVMLTTVLAAAAGLAVMLLGGWIGVVPWYLLGVLLGLLNFYAHAWSVQAAVVSAGSAAGDEESVARRASWKAGLVFSGRLAVVVLTLCLVQLRVGLAVLPAAVGFLLSYAVLIITGFLDCRVRCSADGVDVTTTEQV